MQPYVGILNCSLSGLWINTLSVLTLAAATSIAGPAAAQKASGASEKVEFGAVNDGLRAIFQQRSARRESAGHQNANAVTIVTGAFGSTYLQIGVDLANVLDDGANFRLLPIMGRGSVQTIADILYLKGVDVGIVRRDALAYLERKGYANNIRNQLAYVTKLYNEEMHVVASKSIRSMQDLDGRKVAVDLLGGGTFVTSMNVFEGLGIKPHLLYIESRVAMEMLRRLGFDTFKNKVC
jgi:branched-chain amino acid transport system substrate-binding protein